MKYYAVMPFRYWELCNNTGIPMLVEAKDLIKHRADIAKYDFGHDWILDNSTALGEEVTVLEYLDLVKQFDPPIVVVPDILNDGDRTVERVDDFITRLETVFPNYHSRLMMVPQGKTIEEFYLCLTGLSRTYDPDIFGIPYRYQTPCFLDKREKPIEWALDRQLLLKNLVIPNLSRGTEIHLLGLWHPFEMFVGRELGVRSCDSSLLFRSAVNNVTPYCGEREVGDLEIFEQAIDFENFKSIYRKFRTFIRLIGGSGNDLLPNRFEQSSPNKRTIAEGGSLGTSGGETCKD